MQNYKKNRRLIEITCNQCNTQFEKPISEYNRNVILNRRNFCSRSCAGKSISNINHLKSVNSHYDISQHSKNLIDEFTRFRYYFRNCNKREKDFDLTLQDLKDQWDLQKGICPYTNFQLLLFIPKNNHPYHLKASVDRIDNSKGYIKGNIEFISLPINYLKSDQLSKEETFKLLTNISSNFH